MITYRRNTNSQQKRISNMRSISTHISHVNQKRRENECMKCEPNMSLTYRRCCKSLVAEVSAYQYAERNHCPIYIRIRGLSESDIQDKWTRDKHVNKMYNRIRVHVCGIYLSICLRNKKSRTLSV